MRVIDVDGVNDALNKGVKLMLYHGLHQEGRGGNTLEVPEVVATVYHEPWKRVLLNKERDANPFFHLMEALWILAGRDDVAFLAEFNKRMVDYSDDGETFNASYGYRLKHGTQPTADAYQFSQLGSIIGILRADPSSRQAVCQIWDEKDLTKSTKDKACNMSIVFRIRGGRLDMTVYNRSNDMIWGAYGANMVQFSMIQEYVSRKIGVPMGVYTQVSNSFHVYTTGPGGKVWDRMVLQHTSADSYFDPYSEPEIEDNRVPMKFDQMNEFDTDLEYFFRHYDALGISGVLLFEGFKSDYFNSLVLPMLSTYYHYKQGDYDKSSVAWEHILASDWQRATSDWLDNRGFTK